MRKLIKAGAVTAGLLMLVSAGAGCSAQAKGPTPAEQAAWIGVRAEELGLLPCVLVGHAGGGDRKSVV